MIYAKPRCKWRARRIAWCRKYGRFCNPPGEYEHCPGYEPVKRLYETLPFAKVSRNIRVLRSQIFPVKIKESPSPNPQCPRCGSYAVYEAWFMSSPIVWCWNCGLLFNFGTSDIYGENKRTGSWKDYSKNKEIVEAKRVQIPQESLVVYRGLSDKHHEQVIREGIRPSPGQDKVYTTVDFRQGVRFAWAHIKEEGGHPVVYRLRAPVTVFTGEVVYSTGPTGFLMSGPIPREYILDWVLIPENLDEVWKLVDRYEAEDMARKSQTTKLLEKIPKVYYSPNMLAVVPELSSRVQIPDPLPQFIRISDVTPEGFIIIPYQTEEYPIHGGGFRGSWRDYIVQVKTFKELQEHLNELKKEEYGFNRIDVGAPIIPQVPGTTGFRIIGTLSWDGNKWVEGISTLASPNMLNIHVKHPYYTSMYNISESPIMKLKSRFGPELREMISEAEGQKREIGAMLCRTAAGQPHLSRACYGRRETVTVTDCHDGLSPLGSFHVHLGGADVFSVPDLELGIKKEQISCLGYIKGAHPYLKCINPRLYQQLPYETQASIKQSLDQARQDIERANQLFRTSPSNPEARLLSQRAQANLRQVEHILGAQEVEL